MYITIEFPEGERDVKEIKIESFLNDFNDINRMDQGKNLFPEAKEVSKINDQPSHKLTKRQVDSEVTISSQFLILKRKDNAEKTKNDTIEFPKINKKGEEILLESFLNDF